MKKSITMIALAGIAFSASAQDFSLSITAPTSISEGAVFTVDVIGDASVGTHMLGGGFSLVTTSGESIIQDIVWIPAQWSSFNTDNGYGGNGSHNGVIFGQLVIPDIPGFDIPAPGSEIGSSVGSFQISIGSFNGVGRLDMNLVAADPFSLQVIDIATGDSFSSGDGNLTLNGLSIIIPAPSSLALLGLGGLAAGRRRR